jgi:lipopolysaccharide biosynthesis glycosyltransferase
MDIVLCADGLYVTESIECITYIHKTQKHVKIHLLGYNISYEQKRLLSSLDVNVVEFTDHHMLGKFWYPHFLKIFVPKYFPEMDKMIYLDTDTIVLRRLDPIWNIDLQDYYAAGVIRIGSAYAETMVDMEPYQYNKFGLDPKTKLMNTGVMVLNAKKIREDDILPKLLSLTIEALTHFTKKMSIDEAQAKITHEEFAFNLLLHGKWKELPEKWNVVPKSKVRVPYIIHTLH